ncbi:MAG: T9SS type A sorting domain-containing protein [Flavobacteriales bacterium]|jgi:hypothetical protein
MKKIYSLTLVALLVSTLSIAQTGLGSTVGDLTIKTHDGKDFNLYSHFKSGRAVLLDLWWVECFNCKVWAPKVEQLYLDYGKNENELFVLGLNMTDPDGNKAATNDNAGITKFKTDEGVTYPDAGFEGNLDGGRSIVRDYYWSDINPIFGNGNFAQCVLLMPDMTDAAKSSVIWFDYGAIHTAAKGSVAAIKKAMTDNNVKATYDRVHVSIQEDAKSYNAIYVYPNPTNNNVNIHLDDASSSFTVTIHDLTGKVVYTSDYSNTQDVTISTSDLNSGYYSLSIISSEGISTRKIMVN